MTKIRTEKPRGIVASGHPETSRAAAEILRAGGNAYDAVIAALCAACVAEPLLVSLGGGGFLLSAPHDRAPVVYDFFSQTPMRRRPEAELDFYPIIADFGADQQEFHVGRGSIAVPGVVAGIFAVHRDLGRLPLSEVMQPAISLARQGAMMNDLQQYIARILEPILRSDPAAFALFESQRQPGELIMDGELLRNPQLAVAFQQLLQEGPELMYGGDWAQQLVEDSRAGGGLEMQDMASYQVIRRKPLSFQMEDKECLINPPPSPGGGLIAFSLGLLGESLPGATTWGDEEHQLSLIAAMRAASLARDHYGLQREADETSIARMLSPESLAEWRSGLSGHSLFSRGTTHISVADAEGNMASLTASNGEGSAYVLPGTGIMLNNMLGEEDLNPGGFHHWHPGRRLASMMSPLVAKGANGYRLALGTGGSNRIRSAITQVMLNIQYFDMSLEAAVLAPRMHLEGSKLSLEPGFGPLLEDLFAGQEAENALQIHTWPEQNLFFGGVHAVQINPQGGFDGMGDPRRDGAVEIA
jgi:gamma-glutamyltranspeptidase/glutathione hydrolase